MSEELEYSHVEYFDRLVGEGGGEEDMDSWLSVNVGDITDVNDEYLSIPQPTDMEVAVPAELSLPGKTVFNAKCVPVPTLSVVTPSPDRSDRRNARPFIYDASPTTMDSLGSESVQDSCSNVVKCRDNIGEQSEGMDSDEESSVGELKISFMRFKAGSIALFVPVDTTRKVWMAFHSNKPNHFLAQQSLHVFLNRKGHSSKEKSRILARIVYIEKRTVSEVHTVSPASPPIVALGRRVVTSSPAVLHTVSVSANDNPYNLPPRTVYYECYAEPVTVVKYSK